MQDRRKRPGELIFLFAIRIPGIPAENICGKKNKKQKTKNKKQKTKNKGKLKIRVQGSV